MPSNTVQTVKVNVVRERPRCAKDSMIRILALHGYQAVPVPRCSQVFIEESNVTIHVTNHRLTQGTNRDMRNTISAIKRRVQSDRRSGKASLYVEGEMLDGLWFGDGDATGRFLSLLNRQCYVGGRLSRLSNRERRRERKSSAKGQPKTIKRLPVGRQLAAKGI